MSQNWTELFAFGDSVSHIGAQSRVTTFFMFENGFLAKPFVNSFVITHQCAF